MLEGIGEAVVEGLCHLIGRVALPVLSFGKVRPEGLSSVGPFPWHGFKRMADGQIVASINATTGVGMVIVFAIIAVSGVITYDAVCS